MTVSQIRKMKSDLTYILSTSRRELSDGLGSSTIRKLKYLFKIIVKLKAVRNVFQSIPIVNVAKSLEYTPLWNVNKNRTLNN